MARQTEQLIERLAHWVFDDKLTLDDCEAHFKLIMALDKRLREQADGGDHEDTP